MNKIIKYVLALLSVLMMALPCASAISTHTSSHREIQHSIMEDRSDAFHAYWDALTKLETQQEKTTCWTSGIGFYLALNQEQLLKTQKQNIVILRDSEQERLITKHYCEPKRVSGSGYVNAVMPLKC